MCYYPHQDILSPDRKLAGTYQNSCFTLPYKNCRSLHNFFLGPKRNLQCQFNKQHAHVKIPRVLFSTATTAELIPYSTIFFVAINTVSVGETVAILTMPQFVIQLLLCWEIYFIKNSHIIYKIKSM